MTIGINTSPLAGRGPTKNTKVTARPREGPLDKELVGNVSLKILDTGASGRVGGAGPWRAGAGDPGRADAP
jgi:predicted membrane GTPase involved in stress response